MEQVLLVLQIVRELLRLKLKLLEQDQMVKFVVLQVIIKLTLQDFYQVWQLVQQETPQMLMVCGMND